MIPLSLYSGGGLGWGFFQRASALACIVFFILTTFASSALCDAPNLDQHAGKLITRDTTAEVSKTPTAPVSMDISSGRVALALIIVMGVIFGLKYVGKSLFPAVVGAHGGVVRVVARCPLAPRQQVVLIQVGQRLIVAADCAGQLNSLSQITDADEVASLLGEVQRQKSSPVTRPFTAWFSRARQEYSDSEIAAAVGAEDAAASEPDQARPLAGNTDFSDSAADIRSLSEKIRALARQLGRG